MRVVGTAGHVDHGKSTLVQALTGTHPDRLKEEQQREMTIELGFAWFNLPNGEEVGIVDVPGHRDFIENMLSGVGGIDAVLFVVAADEGVMPQTREHLAILNLLQIPAGVIVLTKTDLVDDPEWLDLVEGEVRSALKNTVLADADLVRVSARKGEGVQAVTDALQRALEISLPRPDLGRPRLPVDRVFTMQGFGTVVTGTLLDGGFSVGDEVEILPGAVRGRVRGLQSHRRKTERGQPGTRTAMNISGVDVEQIRRGDVVTLPGSYQTTRRLDVSMRVLPDASAPLGHSDQIKMFLGSAEITGRARVIGAEELAPGSEGWLQIELDQPVAAVRGDRFILRRPSPGETLGGGAVLDAHPRRRVKRFSAEVLERFERLTAGSPDEVLYQAALGGGIVSVSELARRTHLDAAIGITAAQQLIAAGQLIRLEDGGNDPLVIAAPAWTALTARMRQEVSEYHRANSLRRGMGREELKSRLKLPARAFQAAINYWAANGTLLQGDTWIALPGHEVKFSPGQQARVDQLLGRFAASGTTPPSVRETIEQAGEEIYRALLELGNLVQVSPEVVFRREEYEAMLGWVKDHFAGQSTLSVVQFRDGLNTSRKYALGFLEHLDSQGLTVRDGDVRRWKG